MKVKRLSPLATLPTRGSEEAAGLDLYASEPARIEPGQQALIDTDIALAIPAGYYGRIAPRSGLAVKYGINVLAGVVDSDYRGEVKVCLQNTGPFPFAVKQGDRIAQLIIEKILHVVVEEVDTLDDTQRQAGGFGSTGR